MSETPLEASIKVFAEKVARPWAEEMNRRFELLGAEFQRLQRETRAKPCPCGCGHTLGEVLGDGIINPHMFRLP